MKTKNYLHSITSILACGSLSVFAACGETANLDMIDEAADGAADAVDGGVSADGGESQDVDTVRRARDRWRTDAPIAYTYTFQRSCFCAIDSIRPIRITVTTGGKTARYADDDSAYPADRLRFAPTIDELFDTIEQQVLNADEVDVVYDSEFGFPTSGSFRYLGVADVDWSFTASDFVLN